MIIGRKVWTVSGLPSAMPASDAFPVLQASRNPPHLPWRSPKWRGPGGGRGTDMAECWALKATIWWWQSSGPTSKNEKVNRKMGMKPSMWGWGKGGGFLHRLMYLCCQRLSGFFFATRFPNGFPQNAGKTPVKFHSSSSRILLDSQENKWKPGRSNQSWRFTGI